MYHRGQRGPGAISALGSFLAASQSMRHLYLSGCGIRGEASLLSLLKPADKSALLHLDLSFNPLSERAVVSALAPAMSLLEGGGFLQLQSLCLAGCGLGDRAARALAALLSSPNALRALRLDDNAIGLDGGAALATAMASDEFQVRQFST